jgi:hypothetical protein
VADAEPDAECDPLDSEDEGSLQNMHLSDLDARIDFVPERHAAADLAGSMFQALDRVDHRLWASVGSRTRDELWKEVIDSVQSTLVSSPLVPMALCGKDPPDAAGSGGPGPSSAAGGFVNGSGGGEADKFRDSGRKRRRGADRNEEDDGDSEREGSAPSRKSVKSGKIAPQLFACPFRKMHPWMFMSVRGCLGGWPDVNRLKYVTPCSYCPIPNQKVKRTPVSPPR